MFMPFSKRCKNCGFEFKDDLIDQAYKCPACGTPRRFFGIGNFFGPSGLLNVIGVVIFLLIGLVIFIFHQVVGR
jgi:rubredoxin